MALISVVIPCFKQANFLHEAIDSVFTQTYRNYELVIVDDGSPDHTREVVRRYQQARYIRQNNQGVSAARNRGLRESTGDYVVFLDADDRLLPNHLSASLKAFQACPEAALVCGSFRAFGDYCAHSTHQFDPDDHYASILRFPSIAMVLTAMFNRQILAEVGGFDENLKCAEDFELYLRITKRYPLYFHHELVSEYRVHNNQTTRNWGGVLKGIMTVYRSQRGYIKRNPQYRETYVTSMAIQQRYWGDPVVDEMVTAIKAGELKCAIHALWTLMRFYPQSLPKLAHRKLSALRFQGKSQHTP